MLTCALAILSCIDIWQQYALYTMFLQHKTKDSLPFSPEFDLCIIWLRYNLESLSISMINYRIIWEKGFWPRLWRVISVLFINMGILTWFVGRTISWVRDLGLHEMEWASMPSSALPDYGSDETSCFRTLTPLFPCYAGMYPWTIT